MKNNFFKVLRPGINTTYQDEGRFGLQHFGLAPGGCMDQDSFFVANALVGNKKNIGVIEFAYQGPMLKLIKGSAKIAVTGNVHFTITNSNNEIISGECHRSYNLEEGDTIDVLATKSSAYGYLSVYSGFKIKSFFNSVSTLVKAKIGPNGGSKIKVDDNLIINENNKNKANHKATISSEDVKEIRVLKGAQYDYFSEESKKNFFTQKYKITNLTDRMGMRLQGALLKI